MIEEQDKIKKILDEAFRSKAIAIIKTKRYNYPYYYIGEIISLGDETIVLQDHKFENKNIFIEDIVEVEIIKNLVVKENE